MDVATPLTIPLAVVTQRIWLECKRAPESSAYFVPFVYRPNPGVDPDRLEQALRETVDAHPALRSVVHEVDGKPYQVIRETPAQILQRSDSWEWAITRPFDVENGPLFRFVLCGDIFVLNGSHMVLDGSSILLLLEEVGARYHGQPVAAPGPDAAAWHAHERAYLESPDHEADRAYWTQALAQSDFHAGLPTRRESYRGEKDGNLYFSLRLPQMKVSPFITTLALIQALIHRYTEQEMVAVLYPTDLRGKPFAQSMGSFVNSLIATASFTPDLTFAQLVQQVQEQRRATRAHDRLSFQEVIADLRRARPSDAIQLPNVSVSWARPVWPFALGTPQHLETVDCQNDLLFLAFADGDRLDVRLQYKAAQFTRRFIQELAEHLALLAEQVTAHPETPLSKLMLATEAEVRRIETEWTPPPAPRKDLQLLHDAFSDWAARQPEALALLMRERVLSYGEMERLTNRIAHGLRRRGVKPNTLVAVMMEKGWEQAVACMAILKAGGGYLPINAAWPAERMDSVIEQGEVHIVLSQQRVLDRLGRPGLAVDDAALWADEADSRPAAVNELGDICYVLFTSGSTGKPKGVTLTHFSVMNTLRNANEQHGVGPGDRSLQLSDFAFDLSVYDIFGMLAAGAGVVVPDEARHLEPLHWVEIARQHKATIWLSVPMYADMWVQSGEPLPSMRVFMMGGDKIPTDLPDRMRPLAPGAAIWSVGGPTETSIISNWYPIGEVDPIWTTIPYGRAMLNQKMFVLDHGLNQCPPFMPGRIFMGGVCLARGYWKDQEKTDAAFVTYPATGERIYYTGDLGRWLPDGQVEFLGRADFQVKVNGFRIELGEIEGAIQALPGVKAALVDGQEQPNGKGKFLVAYVVSEEPLDAAQMRAALQDRLPYYMIPRVFVPLERIPLSANGKVDRRALPRPDVVQMPGELPYVAPRTATETTLVDIWQAVLKHEPIGIHDNFYALGGDSLLSVQIGIKAREAGLPIDPTALNRTPTIAELVLGLVPAREVQAGEATGDVPLSPMQRYYFTWATVRPQQFNVSAVFRCSLEPERLRAALRKLVTHLDALRLRFQDGRQFYAEDGLEVPLECADIPLAEVGARAAQMQETIDIAHGPIMRAALFTTEQGQRLVLICHHLVTDGLSWGTVVTDLQRVYLGQALAPAGGTYKSWVEGLIRFATTPEAEAQLPYWLDQQGPTFTPDSDQPGARQRDIVTLESPMLDEAPPNPYERVAAALVEASGQGCLMLHVVGHGREPVVEGVDPIRICGWFTTHTPIVLSGALQDVAGQLRGMPQHGIAHGALRAYHPRGAELAVQDQVKILYNFFGETWDSSLHGAVLQNPEAELLYLKNHAYADNPADFWLYLVAIIHAGKLLIRFQYSSVNYREATIRGLADRMRASLQAHLHEPVAAPGMIALYLLILVNSISATVIIPLLGPLLIEPATLVFLPDASLPLRNFVSGLLVAVYVFLMLYIAPVLGRLSDQWGRRPVLLLCGAGVLLGNVFAGLAIDLHILPLLFLGRLIGGATAAAQPTAQAALVDTGSNKPRLLSYSMLFSSLGFVLGPVVASGLSTISFAAPLYLCTLLTLVALVLFLTSYREEAKPGQRVDWSGISIWEGVCCFRDAASDVAVRGILGGFLLMQVAWGSFFVFVSVYLMEAPGLRLSLTQVGAFMSIMGIGFCISNGLVQPALSERFGMRTLAVAGLALNAATMVLCLMLDSAYQEYAAALVAGITVNIAFPSIVTMLSDRVPPDRQGWILGMVGSAAAMGWGISSVISGALGGLGHALPVMLAAALMAGAALAMTVAGAGWQRAEAPG